MLGLGQPLVDGFPFKAAIVRVHVLSEWALALQHRQQFALKVEPFDDCAAALPEIIEPITQRYPTHKVGAISLKWQQIQNGLHGFLRMAGAGVVDGHVEGEVVRINAQLAELVTADQQMQRQLFVAKVIADHLRQEIIAAGTERELQRALQIAPVFQGTGMIEVVLGQQLAVDHHMVLRRITIAQFFQVGAQQAAKAWIAPMLQQAIQPRAIHQFGRCNRLQKVQRMSLAGKELPRPTCLALLQVIGVLAGNIGAVLGDPVVPGRWIVRKFLGQRGGALQLFVQERLREALRVLLAQ